MTNIYLIFAVAFFFTLIFVWSKRFHRILTSEESSTIGLTITFASVVFALLLAFTISGINDRYFQLRDIIITEVTQLQLIYHMIKNNPDAAPIIEAMRDYVYSVIVDEWPALTKGEFSFKTTLLQRKLDQTIVEFVDKYPTNVIDTVLLGKLSTAERQKRIAAANGNNFLILIVVIAGILTLIGFWLLNVNYLWVQFLVDFGIIMVIFISFYLLYILNNPYRNSEISITAAAYEDLLSEIEGN